jgi:DNA ligase-4
MPYVIENLLATHNTTIAADLAHWDRNSFSHEPLTETVSESQSYPGMRKVVLVEGRRLPQVRDMIRQIQELNGGSFRERVEVYDWRVLEECSSHKKGADSLKRHFIGATLFDDGQEKSLFVAESGTAYLETRG